jgi:hypothetical protein
MNRISRSALSLLAAVLATATFSRAQVSNADTSKPIVIKAPKPEQIKPAKFAGEVVLANTQAITVRSRDDERLVRTFHYADAIRGDMQKIFDQGGYHYGDKVEIAYAPGSDVALHIKGKPSKPL